MESAGVSGILSRLVRHVIYRLNSALITSLRHEGYYSAALQQHLEVSDKFNRLSERIRGCRIILCTLSMLANKMLVSSGLMKQIPIQTLVIDEASQILMNRYHPILSQFGKKLEKMCFIGDDKQRELSLIHIIHRTEPFFFSLFIVKYRHLELIIMEDSGLSLTIRTCW